MSPITRIREPEEIGNQLKSEFGVRVELSGDPRSESGATVFVWVKPGMDKDSVRYRAASLCADLYPHGFYVVPVILPEHPGSKSA